MDVRLPVLLGTVRRGRRSEHVARYVLERLELHGDVQARLVDPRDLPFGNLVERVKDMEDAAPDVVAFADEMRRADGFVVVTPEYNHGIPGTLKNVFDALYDEWNRKPFGVVTCGGLSGGMRAAEHLRQVVSGLQGVPVPRELAVPRVAKAFGPDGPTDDRERWEGRVDSFLDEVLWYVHALKHWRDVTADDAPG